MSFPSKISQLSLPLLLLGFLALIPHLASAQTPSIPTASGEPLETELLKQDSAHNGRDVVTANTISNTSLSVPSLWWAKEQFNEVSGKLINNWIAYPNEKRIDLVVNRQAWTLLDYIKRYGFITKFGAVARDKNYNIRIFNQQGERLATYTCNYSQTPPACEIKILDPFGRTSLPVTRPSLVGD